MVLLASFLTFACLPMNKGMEVLDFNVGIFFVMAASSIGVVGILLAGWSSNSKYSLIGAMRSGAQIISYELSAGLSILTMVVLTGTMQISEIVGGQADGWLIFKGHIPAIIAFIIYLIASNAECNRGPFDLPEAESELTAGYHTEYSGMHFGFFYLAEYLNLFIVSAIAATVFLGGWMPLHIPGLDGFNMVMDYIPGLIWFFAKAFFVVFLMMWMRWTFPRLRIDQILKLEWKYLVPISGLSKGVRSLCIGLKTTMREFFTKKVTEQYPENRKELKMFDRFRGTLTMPHNENNEHHCIACGLCQMACPNGTIKVTSETITTEDGKKKKILAKYEYNLGSCIFCQLCVNACPHNAITFDQNFEHAVFDRSKLILTLNHPGSHVEEKKKDITNKQ